MNESQLTSHRAIAAKLGRDHAALRRLVESLIDSGALSPSEAIARPVPPSAKGGRPGNEYMLSTSGTLLVLSRCEGPKAEALRRELAERMSAPKAPPPRQIAQSRIGELLDKTHAAIAATGYPDAEATTEIVNKHMGRNHKDPVKYYYGSGGPFLSGSYLRSHGVAFHYDGPRIVIDDEEAFARAWPPSPDNAQAIVATPTDGDETDWCDRLVRKRAELAQGVKTEVGE